MLSTVDEFLKEFAPGENDLVFASKGTQKRHLGGKLGAATVIDYRAYGQGEPTDLMVEGIVAALGGKTYDRVFAIGGGTILDVAKLFALEQLSPVTDLYQKKFPAKKARPLILVPTTCGTGSEVTNISILELTKLGTKMGLADAALYADQAVLVPELLKGLPDRVDGARAEDALIHSVESFTSPKSTPFSRTFSLQAMDAIIAGFLAIEKDGLAAREARQGTFLLASTYAGIAFGNAGCAAVHALSYPLGAAQHVPHGEATPSCSPPSTKRIKRSATTAASRNSRSTSRRSSARAKTMRSRSSWRSSTRSCRRSRSPATASRKQTSKTTRTSS